VVGIVVVTVAGEPVVVVMVTVVWGVVVVGESAATGTTAIIPRLINSTRANNMIITLFLTEFTPSIYPLYSRMITTNYQNNVNISIIYL